jgi:hypothetical protein
MQRDRSQREGADNRDGQPAEQYCLVHTFSLDLRRGPAAVLVPSGPAASLSADRQTTSSRSATMLASIDICPPHPNEDVLK